MNTYRIKQSPTPLKFIFGLFVVSVLFLILGAYCAQAAGLIHVGFDLGSTGMAMAFAAPLATDDVVKGLQTTLGEIKTIAENSKKELAEQKTANEKLQKEFEESKKQLDDVRKQLLKRGAYATAKRMPGFLSDEVARTLAASFVLHVEKSGNLAAFAPSSVQRDAWVNQVKEVAGLTQKDALTTAEIPLPTQFFGEMRELIAEFGVIRRELFPFPLGGGVSRPPRMGTRPAFGSIAMSAGIPEKAPTFGFASLESHKIGGLVRVPRELEEQSIVSLGQFLARYGAVEFARAEDLWGFLADGSNTYENVAGICKVATDNAKVVTLAATKTKPSDALLADFRAMRGGKVASPVLAKGKYYLNPTWEARLREFNTEADPYIYVHNGPNGPTLDGYKIVWTEVLEPYADAAAAGKYLAVFGDLSYWWFGERGNPRIDTSEHVFFANDQLATRFIEEIDFDYMALDAASALRTAAA